MPPMRRILGLAGTLVVTCACSSGREARTTNEQAAKPKSDDSIVIDTTGWKPDGPSHWHNARGASLEVVRSPTTEAGTNVDQFRSRMRSEILVRGGGLISAELSAKAVGTVVAKY